MREQSRSARYSFGAPGANYCPVARTEVWLSVAQPPKLRVNRQRITEMPHLDLTELGNSVYRGEVKAIALDTSIFEQYKFGLEFGLLAKLQQFYKSEVVFLFLDVVRHEVKSHLIAEATEQKAHVKNALKPLGDSWGISASERDKALLGIFGGQDPAEVSERRLLAFEKLVAAESLLCSEYADLDDVMQWYFEATPPFAAREAKKNEFPDALCLSALDAWAATKGGYVLAVSKDNDWVKYAEDSAGVCVLSDLRQAMAVFQANREGLLRAVQTAFGGAAWEGFRRELLEALNKDADKIDVSLEASSQFYVESELTDLTIGAARDQDDEQLSNAEVVDFEDNLLQVSVVLTCKIEAEFSVSFQHWDGIDREYMDMGSSTLSASEDAEIEMLLTFKLENGAPVFVGASPERTSLTFERGDLEPDWMNERDDY